MIPRLSILLALAAAAAPATAQLPSLGSLGGGSFGGLSGLAGGLPRLSSIGAGNAAGLLGYCVKRQLLGDANATSVLGRLTGQQGVATSPGYAAGQNGQVVTKTGSFSLDSVKDSVKGKICTIVLDRAQSFIGGTRAAQ